MRKIERTSPFVLAMFGVAGIAVGMLAQVYLSSRGMPPLVPPVSLAATLIVLAALLVVLGVMLRRAVTRTSQRPVDPFHAVRLLAGARAGQLAGALFAGFGAGLLAQVLTRSVLPSASSWAPMLLVLVAGLALLICALITEAMCKVPPGAGDAEGDANAPDQPDEYPA